ncbi:MAG TPA: Gfo/Idh/MocA family oxidoreductase [Terriglobia bacterium]|nr:Gfo/Idh/MocA family oxidoreductase [Terriglobia bacterium]
MKKLNVALIGYKFMGKAHSYALMASPFFFKDGAQPMRKVIVGRHLAPLQQAAKDFGWEEYSTDWREVVNRPDIDVVDIASPPNTHAEIAIEAAKAGKHIFCEKPFTISVTEAEQALEAVRRTGVKHMVGFTYRRVPAIGLARNLIESGRLGRIYHWRAVYLQDWIMDPQFPRIWKLNKAIAGSGSHHELNSHLIDLALYLVGRMTRVVGMEQTFIKQRPAPAQTEELSTMLTAAKGSSGLEPVDVDDATLFLARFANDAVGTFEATRFAAGRRNHNRLEVNGSKGSIVFNLEDMNRLEYYNAEDPQDVPGFRSIMATEGCHPYIAHWWPPGHSIGYQNAFVNQFADFFRSIVEDSKPEPGFEEGLENQKVLEAVSRSIDRNGWVEIG